jgi:processive 1,2-diacylglycerol beta-glucosyltransferase
MSKILVCSASVGAGHLRAAAAVELALRELAPQVEVHNVDVLTLTNAAFRRLYGKTYLDLVKTAPHLLGFVYDYLDKPRAPNSTRDKLRLLVERANVTRCTDMMREGGWDVVVNTHFLPAELIASLRRSKKMSVPQVTVTTDFETHRLWVNEPCEMYTTATDEGAAYLNHWGVSEDRVRVTGIPIDPLFSHKKDRGKCLALHGLKGDRPVVLQVAGGFGVGPIEQIFRATLDVEQPLEIVVVAGKNEKAKAQLEAVEIPSRHRVKVIGFTTAIDELMTVADIVVSKPGGLTTSEVLARGAAMVIVNPIPGQESRNSDFLLENGAAIKINNIGTMKMKLEGLLADPRRLKSMKANALKLAKPKAAFDVAKIALGYV